ncbi:MAG TPA: hypothetical protein PLY93_07320 [Turneriella sp.]|nr:hypothetical protein [Turneriella sp.]
MHNAPSKVKNAAFDTFLEKQFAIIKEEIDSQIKKKEVGKKVLFKSGISPAAGKKSRWQYGLAALVAVGVAVPLLFELNQTQLQEKEALATPRIVIPDAVPAPKNAKPKKEITRVAPTPSHAQKRSKKKEIEQEYNAPTPRLRAAPSFADSVAVDAKKAEVEASRAEGGGIQRKADAQQPSAAPFQVTPQNMADIEKREMEKLWREYKRKPSVFMKDAARVQQLKVLLRRYDTTGRIKEIDP